jgi:hypothetical protein
MSIFFCFLPAELARGKKAMLHPYKEKRTEKKRTFLYKV